MKEVMDQNQKLMEKLKEFQGQPSSEKIDELPEKIK